ncbi:YbgA family protein [Desulfatibacillum aliphaticivorans]|uniref:YbgA family protein n=1 Tax=Desulfatibacillum aliphaticivorans TaxID=218208 RepID=UPI00040FD197|nr:DUF523 and DUF1722 domain-containing protein [Desulfatibacillum aliphaticivorans]
MTEKIKMGIARCLMGEKVRYDGGHKHDRYITQTLGNYFDFVPVCPEMECGMPVPRESMRLEGDPAAPRLMTHKTRRDLTPMMQEWGVEKLKELEKEDLCGYIFKTRSPSSGMERIAVYGEDKTVRKNGVGIWARMFKDHFPLLPVEDEGRLHDPGLRENFITRVFVMKRWRDMIAGGYDAGKLVDFHTRHKLLILAHSQQHYRQMGPMVAKIREQKPEDFFPAYLEILTQALALKTTPAKNINVLQHMMGYFKKQLSPDEKQELLELMYQYRQGAVPLIVPITLIKHFVRKYDQPYLKEQLYLYPHPLELGLRNHG